jgi:hypothetical protein
MPDVRVDNAQRSEVLDLLTRALDDRSLPLDEYDRRVAAVGTATYTSELFAQVNDLPPEYVWQPHPAAGPVAAARAVQAYGRTALILGIVALPLSMCLVGWIFGILAIVYSRRGRTGSGATGFGAALIGRVFGIVSILLSLAAAFAVWFALHHSAGP